MHHHKQLRCSKLLIRVQEDKGDMIIEACMGGPMRVSAIEISALCIDRRAFFFKVVCISRMFVSDAINETTIGMTVPV